MKIFKAPNLLTLLRLLWRSQSLWLLKAVNDTTNRSENFSYVFKIIPSISENTSVEVFHKTLLKVNFGNRNMSLFKQFNIQM